MYISHPIVNKDQLCSFDSLCSYRNTLLNPWIQPSMYWMLWHARIAATKLLHKFIMPQSHVLLRKNSMLRLAFSQVICSLSAGRERTISVYFQKKREIRSAMDKRNLSRWGDIEIRVATHLFENLNLIFVRSAPVSTVARLQDRSDPTFESSICWQSRKLLRLQHTNLPGLL